MLEAVRLCLQNKIDIKIRYRLYFSQWLLIISVSLPAAPVSAQEPIETQTGAAKEILTLLSAKQHPALTQPNFANRSEDLENLYQLTNYKLLWLGRADSEKNIAETLNLLGNASSQGLNPKSYDFELLKQSLPETLRLKPDAYKKLALYDTALSLSLLRFLHDLHYGRINPQGINFKLKLREKKLADLPALIKTSLSQHSIAKLPGIVEPKLIQYQKLKQALTLYRQLDAKSAPLQFEINKSLRPGDHHPQIEQLRQFLITQGDLMPEEAKAAEKTAAGSAGVPPVSGIRRVLNAVPSSITLHKPIYFDWSLPGLGWGQLRFYEENGKLMCANECMKKETVKKILDQLVDMSELEDER